MQSFQRTVLSLAVVTALYSAAGYGDVNLNTGDNGKVISVNGTESYHKQVTGDGRYQEAVRVAEGAVLYSRDGTSPALTIDVKDGSVAIDNKRFLVVDVNIAGELDGTRSEAGPAAGIGLLIYDSNGTLPPALPEGFKGFIAVAADISGAEAGIKSEVHLRGSIQIARNVTVKGNVALDLSHNQLTGNLVNYGTLQGLSSSDYAVKLFSIEGVFDNSGTITGAGNGLLIDGNLTRFVTNDGIMTTPGITLNLNGDVEAGLSNNGTISSSGASGEAVRISGAISGESINTGTIQGKRAINLVSGSMTLKNSGLVDGEIVTGGTLIIDNESEGRIYSENMAVTSFTNEAGAIIEVDGNLFIDENSVNSGIINSKEFAITTATFTNNGNGKATLGVVTGDSVVNTGWMSMSEGSTPDNYTGDWGTLVLQAGTTTPGSAVLDQTAATFNEGSLVKVLVSEDRLKTPGAITGKVLMGNGTVSGLAESQVESGSVFVNISNTSITGTSVTTDIEVLSVTETLDDLGFGSTSKSLAEDLQSAGDNDSSGRLAKFVAAYGSLADNSGSSEQLRKYINQLRPDDSGSVVHTASAVNDDVMNTLRNRSVFLRNGINSGGMLSAEGFWIQPMFGESNQNSREDKLAYEGEFKGITYGFDSQWQNNTSGVAVSYVGSDVGFERDQHDQVKTFLGSLYNTWQKDNWYVDTSFSYGASEHTSERMKSTAQITAVYDSWQVAGQAMAGVYLPRKNVIFEPMFGLRMGHVSVDGYTARNDAGDLEEVVGGDKYKRVEAAVGGAVSTEYEWGDYHLRPRLSLMYYRDFIGDTINKEVVLGGETELVQGASAEKNSYELKLGMNIWSDSKMEFDLGYTRVMKSDFSSNHFKAKMKYFF